MRARAQVTVLSFPLLVGGWACGTCAGDEPPASSAGTSGRGGAEGEGDPTPRRGDAPSAGGIRWEAPAPFRAQQPSSSMRVAEYVFPEEPGERAGTLVVFFFGRGQGGSVQANVDRWVGQFDTSETAPAAIEERRVAGLRVTHVDVRGTFTGGMTPGGDPGPPLRNQRMLAAVVEAPEGPVFFKLVGDVSLVERAEGPFAELLESIRSE